MLRQRVIQPFLGFFASQVTSSIVLVFATVVALVWANLPISESYRSLWALGWDFKISGVRFAGDLHQVIAEGLMAFFFLLVGLEIKREITLGELSTVRKSLLPFCAALGGMVVPAGIFLALNAGTKTALGFGIPTATDIAFSLGVLGLLGRRVPINLKVFLTAFAILDDIGGVALIAAFYSGALALWPTILLGVLFLSLWTLNKVRVTSLWPYLLLGLGVWVCFHLDHIHASIAGVAVALFVPSRRRLATERSLLETLEDNLHSPVNWVIVPLFALANAGITIGKGIDLGQSLPMGILLGLIVGKPIGILAGTWFAVKAKLSQLPDGLNWKHLSGVALLSGIGFTMSLFISDLAFDDAVSIVDAKGAILLGSLVSAILGTLVLRRVLSQKATRRV